MEKEKGQIFLKDYLNFGGYPRVVLEDRLEEKEKLINEIYQSYLEKDVSSLLKIRKTEVFNNLVKLSASRVGNLTNFSELSSSLGISTKTLKDYLWYLQKTFILRKINPYFRNLRKEIAKSPVFYFYDLGLRNHALGRFGTIDQPQDLGFPFQNFILNVLDQKLLYQSAKIGFWRTKDRAEVDFVIDLGRKPIPVEAKYKKLKKLEITRSLKSFIVKYQPPKALVVNLTLKKKQNFRGTTVEALPFSQLLSLNLSHQN